MSHSLRAKIKCLRYKGIITDKECERLRKALDNEPKTGHWIDHIDGRWLYAKCSECGAVHDIQTNYCPNCGVPMDESARSEAIVDVYI